MFSGESTDGRIFEGKILFRKLKTTLFQVIVKSFVIHFNNSIIDPDDIFMVKSYARISYEAARHLLLYSTMRLIWGVVPHRRRKDFVKDAYLDLWQYV